MNIRNLPASVLLVLLGAGATLLIGAFAHFDPAKSLAAAPASPQALSSNDAPPAEAAVAAPLPANLSPGLAEVIKLAQAHVDESLILAYVKNSHQTFAPTAEEILYLSDLGLSQDVISALVGNTPPAASPRPAPQIAAAPGPMPAPVPPPAPAFAPAVAPMAAAPPDASANTAMFYNDLAPYGAWEQQPDYGLVWQPTIVTINPDWSPYVDGGQWMNSDSGWYWQSDYTWGWAVFHYGRWMNTPGQGWIWQPGNNWSPAWVAWRSSPSYVGWAPLPPGAGLNVLAQLTYNSTPIGPNATFGLPASAYTFVGVGSLTSRNLPRHAVPATRVAALVQSSTLLNNASIVNNRIFNGGISPDAVASARNRAVPQVNLRAVSSPDAAGLGLDRKTLAVYVPAAFSQGAATGEPSSSAAVRPQAAENPAGQEPGMLAENDSPEAAAVPDSSSAGNATVQLPPLRYPTSPAPRMGLRHGRVVSMDSASSAPRIRPGWQGGVYTAAAERPSSPAPRFEGYNPPARQAESRPAQADVPRAPAPVRAVPPPAPAPAAPSYSSSKSGR